MKMLLSQLLAGQTLAFDASITHLALDSRKVSAGGLFFAIKGAQLDGHHYIAEALRQGAAAIVIENPAYLADCQGKGVVLTNLAEKVGEIAAQFYGHSSQKMHLIGVTGTNGKTSITHYIEQLLAAFTKSCALIGTLGVYYQQLWHETANTTPDALTLQKAFYQMQQAGVAYAAMEVSSHALMQYRCAGCAFEGAVFTNLSQDHLDYHGTMQAYFAAKQRLFAWPNLQWAVLNADDAYYAALQATLSADTRALSYSLSDRTADVYLSDLAYQDDKYQGYLHIFTEKYAFHSALSGEFNLANLLASVAAMVAMGFSPDAVAAYACSVHAVHGRMEKVSNARDVLALVDYAHTPDALSKVLSSLRPLTQGQLITVFGCGGDRDKSKRAKMAHIAEQLADVVILTSDNPRNEAVEAIFADVLQGFTQEKHHVLADRKTAIEYAVAQANAGDCILVAGKGHEKFQLVQGQQLPFDDVAVLHAAFMQEGSQC